MISFRSLPVRSAAFHWRSNLPVVVGVAVGAAVLTGALLVGDSLRGSLRTRALGQLTGVEAAYIGDRMVRQEIAGEIGPNVIPAMMLQGSVQAEPTPGETRRVNRASVVGVGPLGRSAFGLPDDVDWGADSSDAVLGHNLANQLGIAAGDSIVLGVEKLSAVPRSSLLGKRSVDDVTETLRLQVAAVLPAGHPMNGFSLAPSAIPAENLFVPVGVLQQRLEQPGRVNALLATSGSADELSKRFGDKLTIADWGMTVKVAPQRAEYVTVESDRLVLDPATVTAVDHATEAIGARGEHTLVYLANAISLGSSPVRNDQAGRPNELIAYSIVAGLSPSADPPLGPFQPDEPATLANDEIFLVTWPEMPLAGLEPGTPLTVTYYKPEMEAAVEETSATFRLKGYLPLAGPADDPDLTPPFPGVTDKLSIGDWKAPFPINDRRIQDRDEQYWDKLPGDPEGVYHAAYGPTNCSAAGSGM